MTPKEKAQELINKFDSISGNLHFSKGYTLICINEILELVVSIYDYDREYLDPYWQEVKQEIEKL